MYILLNIYSGTAKTLYIFYVREEALSDDITASVESFSSISHFKINHWSQ